MRFPTSDRRVSSPYGYRVHPITGARTLHAGADFPYPGLGAPLVAIADLTITEVSYNAVGGHIIKGRGPDGVYPGYFHMRERSHLRVGDKVSEGARVGYMGTSGASTGPHLHFETRRADGSSFDPIPYLTQGSAAGGGSNPFPTPTPPATAKDDEMPIYIDPTSLGVMTNPDVIYAWNPNPGGHLKALSTAEWVAAEKAGAKAVPMTGLEVDALIRANGVMELISGAPWNGGRPTYNIIYEPGVEGYVPVGPVMT